ncbi:MAG: serine/threonine-protein kinase [Chloroflexota bacterium]
MDLSGRVLGQYKLIEIIGVGGMATVYKAYQPGLEREVAIKVMADKMAQDTLLRERFSQEARAVAQLSHPNILPIYDVGEVDEVSFFVMKHVSGHTLSKLLGRPLALPLIAHFVDQLASALDHAHTVGILHRDIKPSNILVEGDWLLLGDFGLAKHIFGHTELTTSGMIIGTPTYLSPEQAESSEVDHRADIYSLGVLLYEMLTGQVPFAGDTPMAVMFKHLYEPLPPIRQLATNLPEEINEIIAKALAKNPADRYESAGILARDLRAQIQRILSDTQSENRSDDRTTAARPVVSPHVNLSEDGRILSDSDSFHSPLPEFDPRILESLEAPGGVVKLRDKFYIDREADQQLKREITRLGTTTTIRAPRQMGKSSLMVRGLQYAREQGAKIITLDLQRVDAEALESLDSFLQYLAKFIIRKLRLDLNEVDQAWQGALGSQDKLTYLMEDYVLPEVDGTLILALDEVDRLLSTSFHTSFFALLRSWHNSRAFDEIWDSLNLILVIATEPYLLIDDVNQSPFNVGLQISLDDFNDTQIHTLNKKHGSPLADAEITNFMALLGGHPFLTRKALYQMVSERINWDTLSHNAASEQGPFGEHLRRHHWLLNDEPHLQASLKEIIQTHETKSPMGLFRLLQAGLIKGSGERYTCRCDLYRLYFEDKF